MSLPRIDKDIPIPRRYPFADMEVGDSFLLAPDMKRIPTTVAALRYGDRHNMKFTVRQVPEGFRCWRIE